MDPPALPILYQDSHLIAVHKPAGLLVHRSDIDRHAQQFALQMVRDQIGRRIYPVHRLDRPTAGVLLFALDAQTAAAMTERFTRHETDKRYLAVVRGYTAQEQHIDYPLREEQDRMTDAKARSGKPAQPAETWYRRLATTEQPFSDGRHPTSRYSLIEARPLTGRKHQIRRHMKHVFHPVIGDTTHGDGHHNRLFRERLDCHGLLLCAFQLRFSHPCTEAPVLIQSPLPDAFDRLLTRFGWRDCLPPGRPAPAAATHRQESSP